MSNYHPPASEGYLLNAQKRLAAMYKEALGVLFYYTLGTPAVDGAPYWPYQQEAFPYFWIRVLTDAVEYIAADIQNRAYVFEVGVVFAHATQGYKGETGAMIAESIPVIESYMQEHPMLTTDATSDGYDQVPDYLNPIEPIITTVQGAVVLPNAGTDTTPIGIRVTHSIPFVHLL